jgi:ferredoxin
VDFTIRDSGADFSKHDGELLPLNDSAESKNVFQVSLITPFGQYEVAADRNQHLWDAAQMAGISLPAICHQGRCLTCAGQLLEPGEFDSSDAQSYYPQDREAGYILLCTAKARSNLRIRTHAQTEMRIHRQKRGLPAPYA